MLLLYHLLNFHQSYQLPLFLFYEHCSCSTSVCYSCLFHFPEDVKSGNFAAFSLQLVRHPEIATSKLWNLSTLILISWLPVGNCFFFSSDISKISLSKATFAVEPRVFTHTHVLHAPVVCAVVPLNDMTQFPQLSPSMYQIYCSKVWQGYGLNHNSSSLHSNRKRVKYLFF